MNSRPEPQPIRRAEPVGLGDPSVLRIAQDITTCAVIGCCAQGRIRFWNRGAERLFGHSEHVACGAALADLMRTAGQQAWLKNVLARTDEPIATHLTDLPQHDGSPRPFLVSVEKTAAAKGEATTFFLLTPAPTSQEFSTPTTPRSSEGPLHRDALGTLAGGIAHDFNNLLLGMVGHADLLLMELEPGDLRRRHLDEILQASQRAADLCRQLQAVSGAALTRTESVDVSELVRQTAPLVRFALGPVELSLELAADLAPIGGDPTQLRQVLLDLITNASEALRGQPDGRIEIRTAMHDGTASPPRDPVTDTPLPAGVYTLIEVQDNGPGMSVDQIERAFQPFFTTKFTGRGLGLAAGLGVVRAHRGSIDLCSRPNFGTTVTIALPVRQPASMAIEPGLAGAPACELDQIPRVLVVDDETEIREVARGLLARAGYVVELAEHGGEVLARLAADPGTIDLVLLDVTMPGLDGLEVLARVRQQRPDLPVVLSSGHAPEMTAAAIAGDRHCRFLAKPYRRSELLALVADMLDS